MTGGLVDTCLTSFICMPSFSISRIKKILVIFQVFVIALLFLQYFQLDQTNYGKVIKSHKFTTTCKRIIKGDRIAIRKAEMIMNHFPKQPFSPESYIKLASNCEKFKNERGYFMKALSENEAKFPIGYTINIHKDIEQFERLLRAIYRPQNYYCIHVDKKSPDVFHRAVEKIVSCFSNVFIASRIIEVNWAEFSGLESTLTCMKDLWERSKLWKYLINLTGQEFPLRTNSELVDILQKLGGKSMVYGTQPTNSLIKKRFIYVYNGTKPTRKRKRPFRQNFKFYKGSTYVVLSRAYINFTLHDQLAKDFLKWVKNTGFPDETYYATLYTNTNFDKRFQNNSYRPPRIRHVNWGSFGCHGKVVRNVCINGIGDLTRITTEDALFVNKFHLDYQYLALDCLEQWFHNRILTNQMN
ncbi:beta-1,3-galactosyl-O-glycosyl-glycoprotein beta-1,6-N-acetylglucosaminyltransferase 3-like isoform X2 [Dendronephthya gigantea]|uniref:beta-1,3-galactosyl-O-glycosyl-glycoprotein beta-1,6-N-acetylglucosaminyltransferase 3-like isoform X2 n=1 Tax=Dendronephthya gigantea TaxID=151771 RepID=UPI0010691834|nr:beta-1,3-galactosyl-O-glycosyl-glycoprotein beta-1,6-N-acetylglucosaminyltransferase 3-like isoform X2 [Dendronephthya gigantea]